MRPTNVIARRRQTPQPRASAARSGGRGDPGSPHTITARFIREQAEVLQGYCHSLKRAAAVAEEVERLNRLVADAAAAIELEEEPSRYATVVERSRRKRR